MPALSVCCRTRGSARAAALLALLRPLADEIPSRALLDSLPTLVQAQGVTHYFLPRRWLFPDRDHWLDQPPWHPDYQLRLAVNDLRLLRFPGRMHRTVEALGPARYLDAPSRGSAPELPRGARR